MPYPDSEYPSILRGKDKRQSKRLLYALPEMLFVLHSASFALEELDEDGDEVGWRNMDATRVDEIISSLLSAVDQCLAKAEGRTND
jgi:hypothetical protein